MSTFRERLAERGRVRNEAERLTNSETRERIANLRQTLPPDTELVYDVDDGVDAGLDRQRRENEAAREDRRVAAENESRRRERDEQRRRYLASGGKTKRMTEVEAGFQALNLAVKDAALRPRRELVYGSPAHEVYKRLAAAVDAAVKEEAALIRADLVAERTAAKEARAEELRRLSE